MYVLLDTATTDTLVLDQSFFCPSGMQHFYNSFALVSQICVRSDALVLFGLNDDELLPDLHITGAGVLRAAMVWPASLHTLGHPRNSNQLLLAPDLLTGLAASAARILCRCGFLPIGPL